MGSKDLSALKEVTALMDIGCASLKIEGRMKSLHYIATGCEHVPKKLLMNISNRTN